MGLCALMILPYSCTDWIPVDNSNENEEDTDWSDRPSGPDNDDSEKPVVTKRIMGTWAVTSMDVYWYNSDGVEDSYYQEYRDGIIQMYFGQEGDFKAFSEGSVLTGTWTQSLKGLDASCAIHYPDETYDLIFFVGGKIDWLSNDKCVIDTKTSKADVLWGENHRIIYTLEKYDTALPKEWNGLEDDSAQSIVGRWRPYGVKYKDFGLYSMSTWARVEEFLSDGTYYNHYHSGNLSSGDSGTYYMLGRDILVLEPAVTSSDQDNSYNILAITADRMMLSQGSGDNYVEYYYYREGAAGDEGNIDPKAIVGTWKLVEQEGYAIEDGERWDLSDFEEWTVEFRADGTCVDDVSGDGYSYEYRVDGNVLWFMSEGDDSSDWTIQELAADKMVLRDDYVEASYEIHITRTLVRI